MESENQTLNDLLAGIAATGTGSAGGTAIAVVGAVAASLCEMACRHTEPPAPPEDSPTTRLATQRMRLLALADADAAVVDALFGTDAEDNERTRRRAVGIPLAVGESCVTIVETGKGIVATRDGPAIDDAVTGVLLAEGAGRAATHTVRTNLDMLSDPTFAARVEARVTDIEAVVGDGRGAWTSEE
ncbi:cyclodeaminase/cyclohydrolase family protein [Halosegnis sp.]|uniref:cyclodeaminase/cyclohydrolase family protein n=1 Tax=Halosegnis sp. TaxID=2864959 RepID=UPI0035D41F7B